ncbi:hypothetical protein THAOC_04536, partial [Thalassiosira oceanica]
MRRIISASRCQSKAAAQQQGSRQRSAQATTPTDSADSDYVRARYDEAEAVPTRPIVFPRVSPGAADPHRVGGICAICRFCHVSFLEAPVPYLPKYFTAEHREDPRRHAAAAAAPHSHPPGDPDYAQNHTALRLRPNLELRGRGDASQEWAAGQLTEDVLVSRRNIKRLTPPTVSLFSRCKPNAVVQTDPRRETAPRQFRRS